MYERFFGLRTKPFDLRPDPAFLYLAERHVTALTLLEYGLYRQDGFSVVTGDVGCGKTTLIRYLLERCNDATSVGVIGSAHEAYGSLMPWVLLAFGLDYKDKSPPELHESFADFALRERRTGKRVVLIVDEAQNLAPRTLEELRLLSNLDSGDAQLVHTALIGQPELRATLARNDLRQFKQRVSVSFHLTPLTETETGGYIARRLEVAGRLEPLFTRKAAIALHAESSGIPRLINVLCDTALVYAYADGQSEIDMSVIEQVVADRRSADWLPGGGDEAGSGPSPCRDRVSF